MFNLGLCAREADTLLREPSSQPWPDIIYSHVQMPAKLGYVATFILPEWLKRTLNSNQSEVFL